MTRLTVIVISVFGAVLFLAAPAISAVVSSHYNFSDELTLPVVFAGAGVAYAVMHFVVFRKRP